MINENSRYIEAAHEFAQAHSYDVAGRPRVYTDEGSNKGKARIENRDTLYLITTQPDAPPPVTYMFKETDNIQLLAYKAVQDPTKWWSLADANPQVRHPFDFRMGDILHLPE